MLLYHGSDHIIEKPEFGAGKKHNDYGRGFYCTQNIELAKEWAVSEDADGYVNKYSIYTSKLEVLDINSEVKSKFVCKFIFQLCGFIYATFIFKRFD